VADFAGPEAGGCRGRGKTEAGDTGGYDVEGGEGGVGWVLMRVS